eukprot:12289648-Ditylum_brightwellii.AAC.1
MDKTENKTGQELSLANIGVGSPILIKPGVQKDNMQNSIASLFVCKFTALNKTAVLAEHIAEQMNETLTQPSLH